MNFLQLAQMVKRESGLSGGGPVSVLTAVGDDARVVSWVNSAYRMTVLGREDWAFRRGATSVTTSAASVLPSAFGLTDFLKWVPQGRHYQPAVYRASDGIASSGPLRFLPYEIFREHFLVAPPTAGTPQCWSINPSDSALLLGPSPDASVVVRADYIKAFVPLALDADVPVLPESFHELIVWRGLQEYGGFDAAADVVQRAGQNARDLWLAMAQAQLPSPGFARRPLA